METSMRIIVLVLVAQAPGCLCVADFPDHERGDESTSSGSGSGSSASSDGSAQAEDDLYIFLQNELRPITVPIDEGVLGNDGSASMATKVFEVTNRGWDYELDPNGSFEYAPPEFFWGEDAFSYSLGDGTGLRADSRIIVRPVVIALSDVANGWGGYTASGSVPSGSAGWAVTGAGDFNGDGIDDILVGNPTGLANGTNPGVCFIVFGDESYRNLRLAEIPYEGRGLAINGENNDDAACLSAASVGDMNSDGRADVVIGAPFAGPSRSGRAYVVFGTEQAQIDLSDVANGVGGFVIEGEDANDELGWSVALAGNVVGDSHPDIIVGAPRAGVTGRAYVVLGKDDTMPVLLSEVVMGSGGFAIMGEQDGDQAGEAVTGAIDVNGDGTDDVLVGAPSGGPAGDSAGRVYVVFGKGDTATVNLADIASGAGGYVVDGPGSGARLGVSVSPAGDVDGNGHQDFVVGTDREGSGLGVAYVIFGKDSGAGIELDQIGTSDALELTTTEIQQSFRASVASLGDIDGDGTIDIAVGADQDSSPWGDLEGVGVTYVLYGTNEMASAALDKLVDGTQGYAIVGENAGDQAGYSVQGAGDVNNDGIGDVVIGAPGHDEGGQIYVVFGVPSSG